MVDTPPNSFVDSIMSPKGEQWKDKELGYIPLFTTFWGKRSCWSSEMGTTKSDKQVNYSHRPTQIKQRVGKCIVGTFLVHKWITNKHELTRLISSQPGLGEATTFPLIVFFVHGHEASIQMSFCPRTPKLESQNSWNWDFCNFGGS
jgi:hypothetical protein